MPPPCVGELALKCSSDELRPVAMQLLERLGVLLQQPAGALPRSLVENAAITLGRLAWMCPDALAPHVGAFLGPWYDGCEVLCTLMRCACCPHN